MRNIEIFCKDISGDESEYSLICTLNGEVVKEKREIYSFDDVLIMCYDFYYEVCESLVYDSRFDKLIVNITNVKAR